MSLLPQTILSPSMPIGKADEKGDVIIEQNWWLLFYNLTQVVLGLGTAGPTGVTGLTATGLIELNSLDADANDSDAIVLRSPIGNLQVMLTATEDDATVLRSPISNLQKMLTIPEDADIAVARQLALQGLLLAQDALFPDAQAAAQPVKSITVGASPFSYVLPFNGQVAVTAGTVSLVSIIRQGTTVATGLIVGVFPVSRGDTVQVTYSAAPTMTFLPL